MTTRRTSLACALLLAVIAALARPAAAAPEGQVTFAVTVTLAPTWFDPAETPDVITPIVEQAALIGVGPRVADCPPSPRSSHRTKT